MTNTPRQSPALARWAALLIAVLGGASLLFAQSEPAELPLSIQRIIVPGQRLAKELEKVQKGTLIALPLAEFDARLDRLRAALPTTKPRLMQAVYRAELVDHSLTSGSGRWTIQHAGKAPAVLPIDTLNLALHRLQWDTGGDAVLAELDGKSLGLVVSGHGQQTCTFDWSARGTPTNEGLAFTLAFPACPITAFELKLPVEYWLTAPKGNALVIGPHPSDSSAWRAWKVQVTGQSQLELALRRVVQTQGPSPAVLAQIQSTQSVSLERVQVEHEFQIDILHGSIRELILDGDGGLEPYEVSLRTGEIKSWQWKEFPGKINPKSKVPALPRGVLAIQFHHPMQGKIQGLKVRSLGAPPSAKLWTSPSLRVRNSASRGEIIKIHALPNMPGGRWDFGAFHLTQAQAEPDGAQVLTLANPAPDAPGARRPALLVFSKGLDLHVKEQCRWRLERRGAWLETDFDCVLASGSLSELLIKLPKTFPFHHPEAVDAEPPELLQRWYTRGDFLVIELQRPLTPAQALRLKLRLRAVYPEIASGSRVVPYPQIEPVDASTRQARVAVTIEPSLHAQLLNSSVPPSASTGLGAEAPAFSFDLRDQKLSAAVRLTPLHAQTRWHGAHTISLADKHAALRFRWEVEPLEGAPTHLDLRFAPGFPARWQWKADEGTLKIRHWERLPMAQALPHLLQLGSRTPAQQALLNAMVPAGTYWRFHLAEPLTSKASLVIEAETAGPFTQADLRRLSLLSPAPTPWPIVGGALALESLPVATNVKIWSLPLMAPASGRHAEQSISVEAPNEAIDKASAAGPLLIGRAPSAGRRLQAVQAPGAWPDDAGSLTLWTRPARPATTDHAFCDEARVTTEVQNDHQLTCRVRFRLWHWRDRVCTLRLPAGFRVLAVKLDDRWLDRIDVKTDDGVRLSLPFDPGVEFMRCEIIARAEPSATWLPGVSKAAMPAITWPVKPIDLQERWSLAPGLAPLTLDSFAPVGVPDRLARQTTAMRWLQHGWHWGETALPSGGAAQRLQQRESQRRAGLAAEAQMAKKPALLGEALERFAVEHLKDQTPLVIDAEAFRNLDLRPASPLPNASPGRPFWEALGLVYVPCPDAALLTTPARLTRLGILDDDQTADLQDALKEAILHGHDASGGFALVLAWLDSSPRQSPAQSVEAGLSASAAGAGSAAWTRWQRRASHVPSDGFFVIDIAIARSLGVLAAILTALILGLITHALATGTAFRVCLLVVAGSAVATLWLPKVLFDEVALPMLLAELVIFLWCSIRLLRQAARRQPSAGSTIVKPASTAALLCLLAGGLSWSALAQAPAPRNYPVLIVEGTRPTALVTPELLSKLDELENQSGLGSQPAVVVSAKYAGKLKDGIARFEAAYDVHAFKNDASLVIALSGVQLQEGVFLDGVPAFPTIHKLGYVLPIRAKGAHQLRLSFTARVVAGNEHLDLRFSIPKTPRTEMSLQTPTAMPAPQCLYCCGEEKTTPAAGMKEWTAQLGYENLVHLRWPNAVQTPGVKTMDVREAHCWDLRPASFSLASSFQYAFGGGGVNQLSLIVPEGLHVRSVEAIGMSAPPGAPIIVKHWHYLGKGPQRRLQVEFAQPVTGNVAVNLECAAPGFAKAPKLVLPLPAPLQAKSVAGVLGYRLDAAEVRSTAQNLAVQSIPAVQFEQTWRKQWPQRVLPGELRAYSFQRKAQQAGLELIIEPPLRQAQLDVKWQVDLARADWTARATLTSLREDLSLLEFHVDPALKVAEARGPDVWRWRQDGPTVQIWLRQPRKQTSVDLIGWRASDPKYVPQAKRRLVLSAIYPLHAQVTSGTLHLETAPGLHVDVQSLRGLRVDGSAGHRLLIEAAGYEAALMLRPEAVVPQAALVTQVESIAAGVEMAFGIRLTSDRGKLPMFRLDVHDWSGGPLEVDAPGAVAAPVRTAAARQRSWSIKYPAGMPQEVRVAVRGRMSIPASGQVVLPSIHLGGVSLRDRWIAWKGPELLDAATGAPLANDPAAHEAILHLGQPSGQADAGAWKAARAEHGVKLRPLASALPASLRVLAATQSWRFTDRDAWLHIASFWVQTPEATELRVKLPGIADQLGVFIDGKLSPAWSVTGEELTLRMEADAGPRQVEVKCLLAPSAIETPNVAPARVASAPLPKLERTLWLPRGIVPASDRMVQTPTLLARRLHEADTQLQLCSALAPVASPLLVEHQGRLDQCVRQAEHLAAVLKAVKPDFDFAALQQRITDLKRRQAAVNQGRSVPAALNSASLADSQFPGGLPWLLNDQQSAPPLRLEETGAAALRRTRAELMLLAVVFLLIFSYFRAGLTLVRRLAPELLAGAALLALWLGDIGAIGVLVVAAMLLIRLIATIRIIHRRRQLATTEFEVSTHPSSKSRSG